MLRTFALDILAVVMWLFRLGFSSNSRLSWNGRESCRRSLRLVWLFVLRGTTGVRPLLKVV